MELIPGFKRSEIGPIPEDWNSKPLGVVLAKARLGGNYPNQSVETDYPLMKMGNVARGVFDVSSIEYVSLQRKPAEEHRLSYGDVIFNTRNTLDLVGKVAIWRNELPVAYYNSNLLRLEFNSSEIASSVFANYWLNTATAISKLRALATGTTSVAAIYTRDLLSLPVAVPPVSEQSAIATALSDVDALLVAQNVLIAKKRAIKQGAMQELLTGKRRLCGFVGEWEVKRLGEVTSIRKGQLITTRTLVPGSVPVIAGGKRPSYYHSQSNRSGLTITISASGASAGYVAFHCGPIFASDCSTIGESDSYCIDFVFYALKLRQSEIYAAQTGGAQPHVQPKDLAPIIIDIPIQSDEQAAIAKVLGDMENEIKALESERAKTAQLKDAMMQDLLTGRIRLA